MRYVLRGRVPASIAGFGEPLGGLDEAGDDREGWLAEVGGSRTGLKPRLVTVGGQTGEMQLERVAPGK